MKKTYIIAIVLIVIGIGSIVYWKFSSVRSSQSGQIVTESNTANPGIPDVPEDTRKNITFGTTDDSSKSYLLSLIQTVDDSMKQYGDFGVRGDFSAGINELSKINAFAISESEGKVRVVIMMPAINPQNEIHLIIDKETGTITEHTEKFTTTPSTPKIVYARWYYGPTTFDEYDNPLVSDLDVRLSGAVTQTIDAGSSDVSLFDMRTGLSFVDDSVDAVKGSIIAATGWWAGGGSDFAVYQPSGTSNLEIRVRHCGETNDPADEPCTEFRTIKTVPLPAGITVVAAPLVTETEALALAKSAVSSYNLTARTDACLTYVAQPQEELVMKYEVRENHSTSCGGDPATAPRLFTIRVDRTTTTVYTDASSPEGDFYEITPCPGGVMDGECVR